MEGQEARQGVLDRLIDWGYARILAKEDLPGFDATVAEQVERLSREGGSLEEQADELIRWHVKKGAAVGFVTGLPGLASLPFVAASLTADLVGALYLEMRMVAGLAYLGGFDLHASETKSMVAACVLGSKAAEAVAEHATAKATGFMAKKALTTKMIPVVGGIVGGAVNGAAIYALGRAGKALFVTKSVTLEDVASGRAFKDAAALARDNLKLFSTNAVEKARALMRGKGGR